MVSILPSRIDWNGMGATYEIEKGIRNKGRRNQHVEIGMCTCRLYATNRPVFSALAFVLYLMLRQDHRNFVATKGNQMTTP
jgi:hypothetical protein